MTPTDLHDIARRRALELRDEAIERAWRAAARWAARLTGHHRLRGRSVRAAAVPPAEVARIHRCGA